MPQLPTRLADVAERIFARRAVVTHVEDVAPRLRLIRLEGHDLEGVSFTPGQEIEVRVSGSAFRHYTPSFFDTQRGLLELMIYLHNHGPGSRWAEQLTLGAETGILGPGGRFHLDDHLGTHLFAGDETTIALFRALTNVVRRAARVTGAIEVDAELFKTEGLSFGPAEKILRDDGDRGGAVVRWVLQNVEHVSRPISVYAAGHAGTVRSLKRALDGRKLNFRSRIYWDERSRGL